MHKKIMNHLITIDTYIGNNNKGRRCWLKTLWNKCFSTTSYKEGITANVYHLSTISVDKWVILIAIILKIGLNNEVRILKIT